MAATINAAPQSLRNLLLHGCRRRFSLYVVYGTLLLTAYGASFLLRYDLPLDHRLLILLFATAPVVVIANLFSLEAVGQLRNWWQYAGGSELRDISLVVFGTAAVLVSAAIWLFPSAGYLGHAPRPHQGRNAGYLPQTMRSYYD